MEPTLRRWNLYAPLNALVIAAAVFTSGCGDGSGGILDSARSKGSLSGTITIAAGSRVDQDTALDIEVLDKGPADNPQNPDEPLPGNVILGGYVSAVAGTYDNGFAFPADTEDRFLIELADGQKVSVNFFSAPYLGQPPFGTPETRLTLKPVDADAETVSVGSDSELDKSVVAEAEGLYEVAIEATGGGPARYVLRATALSQDEAIAAQGHDFVPGEAIISYESPHASDRISAQAAAPVSQGRSRDLGGNRQHVRMPESGSGNEFRAASDGGVSHEATLRWIRELQEQPGIASAEPNHRIQVAGGADAPTSQEDYHKQRWHYEMVNLVPVWDELPDGGEGVRIAVLDTGILQHGGDWHPELAPNIDCTDPDGCRNEVDNNSDPQDTASDYHGTHVAGILAADARNTNKVTGVAHGARLVPVKVLSGSEGTVADVIAGVEWVTNQGGEPRADIINLSLGSPNDNRALEAALQEAKDAGILVVGASGNAGDSRPFYPAAYPSVFAVGAVDCNEARAGYSNFGDWLDLVAPGGGSASDCENEARVFSTFGSRVTGEPTYSGLTGTSMAAPHVAGVYALMLSKFPSLSPAVVHALVREGLITGGDGAMDLEIGRGLIDAQAAMDLDNPESFIALAPKPQLLALSEARQSQTLRLQREGQSGDITNVSVNLPEDVAWLNEPEQVSDREYEVSLDQNAMQVGRFYRTVLEVTYEANGREGRYEVPVSATLDEGEEKRDAGAHFVQLIPMSEFEAGTLEPVKQQLVEVDGGRYEFSFDLAGLEPGDYFLVAGTDLDNDGIICGSGEACAEYPVTGQPEPIRIRRGTDKQLELETAFTRPVGAQSLGGYPRLPVTEQ